MIELLFVGAFYGFAAGLIVGPVLYETCRRREIDYLGLLIGLGVLLLVVAMALERWLA